MDTTVVINPKPLVPTPEQVKKLSSEDGEATGAIDFFTPLTISSTTTTSSSTPSPKSINEITSPVLQTNEIDSGLDNSLKSATFIMGDGEILPLPTVPKPEDFAKFVSGKAEEAKEIMEKMSLSPTATTDTGDTSLPLINIGNEPNNKNLRETTVKNSIFTFETPTPTTNSSRNIKVGEVIAKNLSPGPPIKSTEPPGNKSFDLVKKEAAGSSSPISIEKAEEAAPSPVPSSEETDKLDRMIFCFSKNTWNILQAILVRVLFMIHSALTVWRVRTVQRNNLYLYLLFLLWPMVVEMFVAILARKGKEYKWFCPSVFFYLLSIMPSIWILELNKIDRHISKHHAMTFDYISQCETYMKINREKGFVPLSFQSHHRQGLNLPVQLTREGWVIVLEQSLVILLIIGRWLLPKGELTRDQLSQLLLVYIGTAADIMELFEMFKDEEIRLNRRISVIILAIWTWSFIQFTFVITTFRSKKRKLGTIFLLSKVKKTKHEVFIDLMGITSNMIFQDIPFLALRLIIIFRYRILTVILIFFAMKNALVIFIEMYRVFVLYMSRKKKIAEIKHKVLIHSYFKTNPQVLAHLANTVGPDGQTTTTPPVSPGNSFVRRARTSLNNLFNKKATYDDRSSSFPKIGKGGGDESAPLIPIRSMTGSQGLVETPAAETKPVSVTFKKALEELDKVQKIQVEEEKTQKEVNAKSSLGPGEAGPELPGATKPESLLDKVINVAKEKTAGLLSEKETSKPGKELPVKKEDIEQFQMAGDIKELKDLHQLNLNIDTEIQKQHEQIKQKNEEQKVEESQAAGITSKQSLT